MSPELLYADDRLVRIYDTLNAGDHDWVFYEGLIGTAPRRVADVGCGTSGARREDISGRLAAAGFTDVEWYGGWGGEPFDDETSPEIIAIAR